MICADGRVEIRVGDCRDLLRQMPDESVESVVTDPPYGLAFMGTSWDRAAPAKEMWAECLRVLKPGGWLMACGGTRTYHRLVCAIEDAGFEIRDMIPWHYASGFPKSHDVAKGIDRHLGVEGEIVPTGEPVKRMIPGADQHKTGSWIKDNGREYQPGEYVPGTPEAAEWQGWGTALKPATEPICLARKPLDGTVAANVLKHGTGALNIDAARIGCESTRRRSRAEMGYHGGNKSMDYETGSDAGRWPANLVHDGSPEVVAGFPETGVSPGSYTRSVRAEGEWLHAKEAGTLQMGFGDSGSAARFFFCAKASRSERGRFNTHPTVKPVALMQWLVRLVTPPGGTVLDPFSGSGTTGLAAAREGFRAILMEQSADYAEIAARRIREEWREPVEAADAPDDLGPLFQGAAQ